MRYIQIDRADVGMILDTSIFDNAGRVLLGKGTILTKEYINKLILRGHSGIYIEDELAKDIELEETITQELRNRGVNALRRGDVDETMSVGRNIVDEILQHPQVSLDMIDLRSYDDYTYRHSVNVAVISTVIGIHLGYSTQMLQELSTAAILHDIGKSKIPAKILNKPGKLTSEEYDEMKKHPEYAYDMLKERLDIPSAVRAGILCHHENEDGSGYSKGITGNNIYSYGKVIHVADVFDALTSQRPYKKAFARSEATEYLMGNCERLFDQRIVLAFLQAVSLYPKGTTIRLSDGREAIVIESTDNTLRPKVRLMNGEEIDLSDFHKYRNITIVPEEQIEVS
jgi:HD-GYP domain-containing protein (c-di-GMP phosphodiesterase class II)